MQCVAYGLEYSVLQYVAVCCGVLWCVAVCCVVWNMICIGNIRMHCRAKHRNVSRSLTEILGIVFRNCWVSL